MKITLKREYHGAKPFYRVHVDGQRTMLTVEKDTTTRRKWGAPQEWDVLREYDDDTPSFLFTAKGKDHAQRILQTLAEQFAAGR